MTQKSPKRSRRIAIAGLGAVGMAVVEALEKGIPGCRLTAVSAADRARAAQRLAHLREPVDVVEIERLEALADIVVECAPSALLDDICRPFLAAGKTAIVLSAGALLDHEDLIEIARENGGQIIVPSGALLGLDAVAAAAEGTIHSVRMVTRKPVGGLAGAPFFEKSNQTIQDITEPILLFSGSPREAIKGFPANLNVSVALSLAGIGPDRTTLDIWADPAIQRNMHRIDVDADSARFSMSIENIPTENPKTGRITALSVISCLRKMGAPLRVGG
ncbi:MAG TPA: aspartate dehydrogenase [Xanthobacteraceae bacterium]|jgi:aspartate dehydrogenase|nr:aspartate dehydrogenase [Xanthobacteraceae bacterium]